MQYFESINWLVSGSVVKFNVFCLATTALLFVVFI